MIYHFRCHGWCSFKLLEAIEGEPPEPDRTAFEGTYEEAVLAGWMWISDIRFSPDRNAVPICPECAKRFKGGE